MSEIGSGEDVVKRGRGRPKKEEGGFVKETKVRMTEEQDYMKKALEDELGKNGGEVMREALELLYNMKIGWK